MFRKLIRLWVMTKINHTEDYIKDSMMSADMDIKNLTHFQICAYKASFKQIEADLLIESAFSKSKPSSVEDIDISVFKSCTKKF